MKLHFAWHFDIFKILGVCKKLEISFKESTFDFSCSVFVHNLSQFTIQDLWRELIFTLEGVKSRYWM